MPRSRHAKHKNRPPTRITSDSVLGYASSVYYSLRRNATSNKGCDGVVVWSTRSFYTSSWKQPTSMGDHATAAALSLASSACCCGISQSDRPHQNAGRLTRRRRILGAGLLCSEAYQQLSDQQSVWLYLTPCPPNRGRADADQNMQFRAILCPAVP